MGPWAVITIAAGAVCVAIGGIHLVVAGRRTDRAVHVWFVLAAAMAAANGLSFDQALAAITLDAAQILGIEGRVGSLEVGKDGDVALFDGDPFEYTSHCLAVIIEGQVVSRQSH